MNLVALALQLLAKLELGQCQRPQQRSLSLMESTGQNGYDGCYLDQSQSGSTILSSRCCYWLIVSDESGSRVENLDLCCLQLLRCFAPIFISTAPQRPIFSAIPLEPISTAAPTFLSSISAHDLVVEPFLPIPLFAWLELVVAVVEAQLTAFSLFPAAAFGQETSWC